MSKVWIMSRERSNWRDKGGNKNKSRKTDDRSPNPRGEKKGFKSFDKSPRRERSTDQEGDFKPRDGAEKPRGTFSKPRPGGFRKDGEFRPRGPKNIPKFSDTMRLNKYLSNAGVCGRREADVLIGTGAVSVNGVNVTELGIKVNPSKDVIKVDGNTVSLETKHYFVLNKPKDFLGLMGDAYSRKTVSTLMEGACKEAIYPVDKVDKMTSGLLLFTNDGDFLIKLSHPKFRCKRIYHVTLNRKISDAQLQQISEGVEVEGGFVKPDEISFVGNGDDKTQVGITVSTGRNSAIKRLFDSQGFKVVALDRVYFSGITKKNLPRGKYRKLTEQEVINLKNMK